MHHWTISCGNVTSWDNVVHVRSRKREGSGSEGLDSCIATGVIFIGLYILVELIHSFQKTNLDWRVFSSFKPEFSGVTQCIMLAIKHHISHFKVKKKIKKIFIGWVKRKERKKGSVTVWRTQIYGFFDTAFQSIQKSVMTMHLWKHSQVHSDKMHDKGFISLHWQNACQSIHKSTVTKCMTKHSQVHRDKMHDKAFTNQQW